MKKGLTYLCACLPLLAAGCFKEVGTQTDLVLKPWLQHESGAPFEADSAVIAYAFEADTARWTVASYENARNGILTARNGSETRTGIRGERYGEDSIRTPMLRMHLERNPVILLAVDTVQRLYGFRAQELGENLSPLYVSVVFRPWRQMRLYEDGAWIMINDFYEDGDENEPTDR